MKIEQRGLASGQPFDVEERAEGGGLRVSGYAAVFEQRTLIGDHKSGFYEQIAPGAFRDALGRDEVVFLYNHDNDTVMARTSANNLELDEDKHGLRMSATLSDDDPDVQRLMSKMRSGNVNKMSFAFRIADPKADQEIDFSGDIPVRTLKRLSLHDVSAVTEPAYPGTEIGFRMVNDAREELLRAEHNRSEYLKRKGRMALGLRGYPCPAQEGQTAS